MRTGNHHRPNIAWAIGYPCVATVLLAVALAGCGNPSSAGVKATMSPGPTATPGEFAPPTPTPTAGLPCKGGPWGGILSFAGPQIPLPPLTVSGFAETFPPSGSWVGHYLTLCTGGNLDSVANFIDANMPPEGWNWGPPPSDCLCNGGYVWSRAHDGRLVQFEPHPSLGNGDVRWGVTVYTHL